MNNLLNVTLIVRKTNEETTNEVKRFGLVHDLENTLELR
jgi:hypothetical protein